jgi:hypothetical protein
MGASRTNVGQEHSALPVRRVWTVQFLLTHNRLSESDGKIGSP